MALRVAQEDLISAFCVTADLVFTKIEMDTVLGGQEIQIRDVFRFQLIRHAGAGFFKLGNHLPTKLRQALLQIAGGDVGVG